MSNRLWSISTDDTEALRIIIRDGQKSLTDLVREIYGIETDKNGKDDNSDRIKKINRFKSHLKNMVDDGFLEATMAKTERSTRPIKVYSIAKDNIFGRGVMLIWGEKGIDVTEIGTLLKVTQKDGKPAILPLLL